MRVGREIRTADLHPQELMRNRADVKRLGPSGVLYACIGISHYDSLIYQACCLLDFIVDLFVCLPTYSKRQQQKGTRRHADRSRQEIPLTGGGARARYGPVYGRPPNVRLR